MTFNAIDWPCIAWTGTGWELGVGLYRHGRLIHFHPEAVA